MSVQGSGPLRFETGVVEGDIMKLPYDPSRLLETSWCYTSDIYHTYAERNLESSESVTHVITVVMDILYKGDTHTTGIQSKSMSEMSSKQ